VGMLGVALSGLAGLAMVVFSIQILITAFKTSVAWGLLSLFIPFPILVFIAKNWEATKTPFLRSLIAFVVVLLGSAVSAFSAMHGTH